MLCNYSHPKAHGGEQAYQIRGRKTEQWNGVTTGRLLQKVDEASRFQPMSPVEGLPKKQKPGAMPRIG